MADTKSVLERMGQGDGEDARHRHGSTNDLATPESIFDKVLQFVPRALSSKPHIVVLLGLGIYLIVLPVLHIYTPGAQQMLIGGNYTNVTSDVGACIAAGGTLHLVAQTRKRRNIDEERLRLLSECHTLLHHVHSGAAVELGHAIPTVSSAPDTAQKDAGETPTGGGTE